MTDRKAAKKKTAPKPKVHLVRNKNAEADPPEIAGTPDQRKDAHTRAEECNAAIQKALAQWHCRLVPFITEPEPVGRDGTKMQIGASLSIVPDPLP